VSVAWAWVSLQVFSDPRLLPDVIDEKYGGRTGAGVQKEFHSRPRPADLLQDADVHVVANEVGCLT